MKTSNNEEICHAIEIAQDLIDTADQNENSCKNDTCLLVYGILRDCGYRIINIVGDNECKQPVY